MIVLVVLSIIVFWIGFLVLFNIVCIVVVLVCVLFLVSWLSWVCVNLNLVGLNVNLFMLFVVMC